MVMKYQRMTELVAADQHGGLLLSLLIQDDILWFVPCAVITFSQAKNVLVHLIDGLLFAVFAGFKLRKW